MTASPKPRPARLARKLAAVAGALLLVPGGAFLAAANVGTGGRVAIGVAVAWWVIASTLLGRTVLRRWPDLRGPVRGTLAVAAVAAVATTFATTFVLTRDEAVDERIATGSAPAAAAAPDSGGQAAGRDAGAQPRADRRGAPPRRNVQVLAGGFTGESGHAGTGEAAVVELAEGGRVLTFSDFDVDMGAGELRVYLARGEPGSDGDVRGFEDLAPLKGNVGTRIAQAPLS